MIPLRSLEDHIFQVRDVQNELDGFFISDETIPMGIVDKPHRSAFFAINITMRGYAYLKCNLKEYEVKPHSIVLVPPQVVRYWENRSEDYLALKIFFTEDFFQRGGSLINLSALPFFKPEATNVFDIDDEAYFRLTLIFKIMRDKLTLPHEGMEDILRHYLNVLFLEIEELYKKIEVPVEDTPKSRGLILLDKFKKLVAENYLTERSVSAYAQMLFISPTHLSNTIKEVSGKTPTEIIQEMIILDAQVMLRQTTKPINEIADYLGYSDSSYFGKFFKKHTRMSPVTYRLNNK